MEHRAVRPSWRDCALIALVTAAPAWVIGVCVIDALFPVSRTDPAAASWLSASFTFPSVLAPILCLILDWGAVRLLAARGKYRSDQWWLAGAIFVVNALVVMVAIEAPTSGEWVYLHILLSVLSGYWIITFAAGALIWRRLTPTFVPEDWLRTEGPDDEPW